MMKNGCTEYSTLWQPKAKKFVGQTCITQEAPSAQFISDENVIESNIENLRGKAFEEQTVGF